MQEFFINKGSTLPALRMEVIMDGRRDYEKFCAAIQNASVTFSMTRVSDGIKKVGKSQAKVVSRENNGCEEEYLLQYDWKERDTKYAGVYRGQFEITFEDGLVMEGVTFPKGKLTVPIQDELMIYVLDGSIKK